MEQFSVKSIGKVCVAGAQMHLAINKEFIPALTGLEGLVMLMSCGGLIKMII